MALTLTSEEARAAFRVSYRAIYVWMRNRDTFLRLWRTELVPPFIEPIFYFFAFGVGMGAFVGPIEGQSYLHFIGPGMLAQAVLFIASLECAFGSYFRMEYQRTFAAIVTTPASVEDVIAGEILWGMTRGFVAAIPVFIVVTVLGYVESPLALLALPVALVGAWAIASFTMVFTALASSINAFNYLITLLLTPMLLFSGVYFPVSGLPSWLQSLVWLSPVVHFVNPMRALMRGQPTIAILSDLLWLLVFGAFCFWLALALMRRRLVK